MSLWTDPQNCGGCGRSCGSAACDTHCVPNVAYQAASPLLGGVADASYLYVSELNGITRVPHGGGPAEPLTQSVSPSAGIAVDATHAYFANLGTQIVKVSLQDSSTSVLGAAPGAVAVVVDGGDVFWAGGTSVAKLPAAGGPGTTLASQQVSPGGDGLSGLLVVGDDVFWTTGLDAPDAAILRVSRNGGPVSTIASGLQGPLTIATDGTHLFWSESDQGIYRANLDGTEARQISWSSPFVRGLVDDRPTSLAVTDTHVYWGTLNGGVLYCEKAGGPPSILSGYLGNQTSLVILAPGTVYWAEPAAVYSTPAL